MFHLSLFVGYTIVILSGMIKQSEHLKKTNDESHESSISCPTLRVVSCSFSSDGNT